jgi:phage baseplate assembly protein W
MDAKAFLGRGWAFPVRLDAAGEIEMDGAEEDIRQSIRIILGTAPGERAMRPAFGCGIHDRVFAAVSMATIGEIETAVREALVNWEPRIEVESVRVSSEEIDRGRLLIGIGYRVRSTNNRFNLVYPFYLREQAG